MKRKVSSLVIDVEELSTIAKEVPQIAYSAFTTGLSSRWCYIGYIQRTVPGITDLFILLQDTILKSLIPAIAGRNVSDIERDMIALPLRYGGLGIQNPTITVDREYNSSKEITKQLNELICIQDEDIAKLDRALITKSKNRAET